MKFHKPLTTHGGDAPLSRAAAPKDAAHLVNVEEIARTLNVSKRQVQKMMRARAIPFVTLGRRCVRFDPREVLAFVKRKYGIAAMDADTR